MNRDLTCCAAGIAAATLDRMFSWNRQSKGLGAGRTRRAGPATDNPCGGLGPYFAIPISGGRLTRDAPTATRRCSGPRDLRRGAAMRSREWARAPLRIVRLRPSFSSVGGHLGDRGRRGRALVALRSSWHLARFAEKKLRRCGNGRFNAGSKAPPPRRALGAGSTRSDTRSVLNCGREFKAEVLSARARRFAQSPDLGGFGGAGGCFGARRVH